MSKEVQKTFFCEQTIAQLEQQYADILMWQEGMKVVLNHLADKLQADGWTDSRGNTILKDEMSVEVASNLRALAANQRVALKTNEE